MLLAAVAAAAARLLLPLLLLLDGGACLDNGLSRRPILGWNSWGWAQAYISHDTVSAVLDQYVAAGLPEAGYTYFNLDNGWQLNYRAGNSQQPGKPSSRDPDNGKLLADPAKFPRGMKAWCDEVHGAFAGAKCGIYTMTCLSEGHWDLDARTFEEWGVGASPAPPCWPAAAAAAPPPPASS